MCATLTENVVLTRTRSHDLKSVRKLNCWGCTLKDVSIVSRMPSLEVISLSINSIDTLSYFAPCSNLQELYLRKNEIKNLNEILHLAQLQCLKKLSLEDNPCNQFEHYRLTVLKALPTLEFLDNVRVTPEEIYQAEKYGRDLSWPGSVDEEEEEIVKDVQEEEMLTEGGQAQDYGNNDTAEGRYSLGNAQETPYHTHHHHDQNETPTSSSAYHHASSTNLASNPAVSNNRMHNGGNSRHSVSNTNMAKSNSLSDYNLYNNYGNYRGNSSSPPPPGNYEPSVPEYNETAHYNNTNGGNYSNNHGTPAGGGGGTPSTPHPHHHHNHNGNSLSGSNRTIQSSSSSTSQSAQSRLLPKGGKNRNANILSAVLCLIKELDYGSLEVVDTTIHCRMEEMED